MEPQPAEPERLDDLLDRLVSEFSDRVSRGEDPGVDEFLTQVPAAHQEALARCLRMLRSGIAAAPTRARPLGPGVVLDGFRIEREIGRGGMATVFLAEQLDLRRMVALKVLRPGLAVDRRHVDRFRREGLAVARLQHPHVVQIHAVGEADGYHYLAMEYVEGRNLAQVIAALPRDEPWTAQHLADAASVASLATTGDTYESAIVQLLTPVSRAIAVAHELGLVHRDIKPSNILIHHDGRAMVADFGLAKGSDDPALSMTGEPLGTPYYMSPEQAEMTHHTVDERTDIYSLGVTLYECLAGCRPFEGDSALAVMDAIRAGNPVPMRARGRPCTRSSEAVVKRAMARRKEDRYPTAIGLAADLAALAEGRQTQALAEQGGLLRRVCSALREMSRGQGFEYVSPREFLGMPLVHINYRLRRPGDKMRRARGWLAMADIATGGLAIAPFASGIIAIGAFGLGLLSMAGTAIGGYAFGGLSGGVFASGGCAAGFAAVGGTTAGYYATGGLTFGAHVISPQVIDPAAVEFFATWMPWVGWFQG